MPPPSPDTQLYDVSHLDPDDVLVAGLQYCIPGGTRLSSFSKKGDCDQGTLTIVGLLDV